MPITFTPPSFGPFDFGPISIPLPTFPSGPSQPLAPTGCPPGTVWRGVPWQSNVCDPISGPTNPVFPIGPVLPPPVPLGPVVPVGNPPVPIGPAPQPQSCDWPWKIDPISGQCKLFFGTVPGPDPSQPPPMNGGAGGGRIHGEFFHTDHPPARVALTVRRCGRGSVLGKDGWCHPKGSLRNSERLYPRPTRPLGTRAEMKAITVAGQFARRLKTKKKTLKKLSTALGSC